MPSSALPSRVASSLAVALLFLLVAASAPAELARRPSLGVLIAPPPPDAASDAPRPAGVYVQNLVEGSAAAEGGIAPGDTIVSIDDQKVANPGTIGTLMGERRAAKSVRVGVWRQGEVIELDVPVRAMPRETSDGFETLYDEFTAGEAALRCVVTKPAGDGPFAAVVLVQGLGCGSIESPTNPDHPYRRFATELTQRGLVVFRMEKSGLGDSTGTPCLEIDFLTELEGYQRGLEKTKSYAYVDPARVFLFGHSMGGAFAPIMADAEPVAGVIVYGTLVRLWMEYYLENIRRQSALAGADHATTERLLQLECEFMMRFLTGGESPRAIYAAHPHLKHGDSPTFPDDDHLYGRHYAFFHQLDREPMAARWAAVTVPVLAIRGQCDFVTSWEDHRLIAEIVNNNHPGNGEALHMEHIDHGFLKTESEAASLAGESDGFNTVLIDAIADFVSRRSPK